ncbi:hypothetical protein CH063_03610 [Colletotrichum higginsianum]|uniref:Uncharacterized protein n=1 Tax=Colletotrichum higginsianum (strain IMI 349063) TaxID=759273 RepID=H1VZ02_COLHI|nr:hypothetical protein CH063_03610 [Colletotrichum higginsianum]
MPPADDSDDIESLAARHGKYFEDVLPSSDMESIEMEGIRAYLSCYYLVTAHVLPFLQYLRKTTLTDSRFAMAWARMSQVALSYTSWTATCCDLLERGSALKGDHTLAWLARLLHITEEASETTKNIPRTEQAKQQAHFMLLGLESQLRDWQSQIPSSLGDVNSIKIAILFTEIFLLAGPVYRLTSVSKAALVEMSSIDWGRFIQATILQFDSYLAKLSTHHEELTPSTKSMDVLSASKLVFAVIKRKYEGRVANIDTPVNKLPRSMRGCPMFDGSLDAYFPIWDQDAHQNGTHGLVPPMPDGTLTMANGQPVYADLWATMTMGWSDGVSDDPNQGLDLTQGQHPTLHLDPSFQETMHLGPSPTGTG